jgi:4-hydroxybenzoate polyprenyltransferase
VGEESAGARAPGRTRTLTARAIALVSACHPEPAATVALGAGVLALGAGRGWGTLAVVAAIGAGQLAVGWSNDYLDRDADRAVGRLDKPIPAGRISARAVGAAAVTALVAAVPLSLASGLASALTHFAALGCALAYNAGLKNRPVSVLPYAAAFGLLPAIVTLGLPASHWPPVWAVAAGALIGTGGHFTQVLSDIPNDRALGSAGMPQLLGQRASAVVAALLLAGATALVTFGPGRPGPLPLVGLGVSAVLSAGILVSAARGRMRTAFRLTLVVAAVAVLTFLASGRSL